MAAAVVLGEACCAAPRPARAQPAAPAADGFLVPGFWDPKRRLDRPELGPGTNVRFLTETDYPPFNFAGPGGNPAGFNVDLARLACEELRLTCTVQMRRFETLLDVLNGNQGDAVIASLAATAATRQRADFTDPYYRSPARFVARRDSAIASVLPEQLSGAKVGVVSGTAHEAYLKAFFAAVDLKPYPDVDALRTALKAGEIDLVFGDGIQLAYWLNGSASEDCCAFRGGPFMESRYFGEGVGIAVRRGNDPLRQALNWALFRIWEKGAYTDLWLRYFPISPF